MTYNEWRDELKNNLLSVSDAERRRVLDYYAEAYADRREAGFSEREIIDEFGAPYDAAQRILNEDIGEEPETPKPREDEKKDAIPPSSPPPTKEVKKKGRTAKIVLWVISGIVILGIVSFIVLFAVSYSINPKFAQTNYVQQTESVQNISIDAQIGNVETVFYDGDKIEIDYYTSNIYNVEIGEKNGTLVFKMHSKRWLVRWGSIKYPKTTIKLPQANVYNLNIDLSAGMTTVNGGTFGDLKIDLSAGTVNISGHTVCTSLDIDLSAGKVNVGKVECSGSFAIDLSAGTVSIDEAVCERLDIDLSAGTVGIGTLTCPKIKIDLSAGTVNLGIVGQQSEYTITVDKSAGKCNVGNQRGTDADKIIDIDLSAGTVTVSFTNKT